MNFLLESFPIGWAIFRAGFIIYFEIDADGSYEIAREKGVVLEANEQACLAHTRVAYEHHLERVLVVFLGSLLSAILLHRIALLVVQEEVVLVAERWPRSLLLAAESVTIAILGEMQRQDGVKTPKHVQ